MNRFCCYSSSSTFPNIAFRSRKFSVFTARIRSDNKNHQFYSNQRTHHSFPNIKPVMNDLQKQEIYDQLYEGYQCISRIPPWFCSKSMQIAISLNDSKARDQAALNLASIMGTLGIQRATDSCKKPNNRSPG
jgi:hypothetical protein